MGLDLDNWIEKIQKSDYLTEDELKALCEFVSWPVLLHALC